MGTYDGVEVSELIDLFLLNDLSSKFNKNDIDSFQ